MCREKEGKNHLFSFPEGIRGVKVPLIKFFESKYYPPLVAFLVALGHITGIEYYLNIIVILMAGFSLILCESAISLITPLITFLYQIPLKHSPGIPTFSDYYFKGWKLPLIAVLAVFIFGALIYRFILNFRGKFNKKTPILIPITALSVAFLLNGVFSSGWNFAGLLLGFIEAAVYFLLFYLLYFGFAGESSKRLIDYFCYCTLFIALTLITQIAFMFLTYDNIIVDGSVIKENINLGWGIWNPIGFALTVIIPILVLGATRMKYPAVYFTVSVLTYICAVLTMSRNALIFATLGLGVSFVLACFFGERKKLMRIATAAGIVLAVVFLLVLREKIADVFAKVLEQGLSDNGRFELWKRGIENFLCAPVFGKGLFGYGDTDVFIAANFIPTMAHNTIVQLLSSMGIAGTAAYGFYRVKTLLPLFRKPTFEKAVLYLPILLTLGMSLLDNFVFYVYTVFYYTVALAIIFRVEEEKKEQRDQ